MAKIRKAFKALWWIARKPVLLNRVLTDEDSWQMHVDKKHHLPSGLPVIEMDQVIDSPSHLVGPMTFLDGGSLPTDMMLLAGLADKIQDCTYFEIGTWRGESVATVASRAKSCHTLCLSDQEMKNLGMHERTIVSHRLFSKDLKNVVQLRGDSRTFDYQGLDQKFDLVFIDGDHHYDFIKSDTEQVFRHLIHDKSVVVWHDYGFHPDLVRFEVMAAILDGVGQERASQVYQVAHTKSAIFTGEELSSKAADFPVVPEEYYDLKLTRKKI